MVLYWIGTKLSKAIMINRLLHNDVPGKWRQTGLKNAKGEKIFAKIYGKSF